MLLQSKNHGELLDIIDDLRSLGISQYVDLPQLVVCGDQSSGKSSVLEAVSGIPFPQKDNLCTRFATEVILRRFPKDNTAISIVPASDRSEEDKKRLLEFEKHDVHLDEVGSLIEEAKLVMGLGDQSRSFTQDVLRVELSGPTQPHLTLVDLPGLFQAGNKTQSVEDAEIVTSLVLSYMKKRRSIILAVVSAKNDFANQIVTRYARELDPQGDRTLGIITKPDTLHVGSDSEKAFVELAENKDVAFRLGWHVLRNRDYDTRNASTAQRDEAERQFLSQGIWATLPSRHLGVTSLKPRLSTLLRDQIMTEIPSLIDDVERGVQDCESRLAKLGASRANVAEQRSYLLTVSQTFTMLMRSAVDGVYSDSFFGKASTPEGYQKRLRAVVQNTLLDFARTMRRKGHSRHIVDHVNESQQPEDPRTITRDQFVVEILTLMKRSRGCELPGTYNPQIIGDLFQQQSEPWQLIIEEYAEAIWKSTMTTVKLILDHASDEMTANALQNLVIGPATDEIKEKVSQTIAQILLPHQKGHPITYNHYLTDNIQKSRIKHQRKDIANKLDDFFGTDVGGDNTATSVHPRSVDVASLLNIMTNKSTADMDHYACSEAIDCMKAYYKVAIKTLIDEFSVLAQERCLLQKLPGLFPPEVAIALDDEQISQIAAETEQSMEDRSKNQEKLSTLRKGLATLKKMQRLDNTSIRPLVREDDLEQSSEPFVEDDEVKEPVQELGKKFVADLWPPEEVVNGDAMDDSDWGSSLKLSTSTKKNKKKKQIFFE